MKKILITGSSGIIGTIITNNLTDYQITKFDSEEDNDATDLEKLKSHAIGHDVIIHLAWNMTENWNTGKTHPHNLVMAKNVYETALNLKIPRVIMASSVHVQNYRQNLPGPDSPYGESKLKIEEMGKDYAKRGVEVVCVRFGGINPANKPEEDPLEAKIFLSHEDCINIIELMDKKCW